MNKVECRADCVIQEKGSVQGVEELKAKADELFLHSFIFSLVLFCKNTFFLLGCSLIKHPSGLLPSGGGPHPKMGRSQ